MLVSTPFAIPVLAAGLVNGSAITISKDEVVDEVIYFAGQSLIIDGTVNGDIFGVAQDIIINGTVNGGVTIAARDVTITGTITNGARIAAQTVTVSGKIGRDLFAGVSDITITPGGNIKRDLFFGSQQAIIAGNIGGKVKGGSEGATISGKIGGDVELWITRLDVTNTASINGKLTYTSNNPAIIESGSKINGVITRLPEPPKGSDVGSKILGFFMIAVTGIIAVLLLGSSRSAAMADSIRSKTWLSLGWGALLLVATPIVAVIVMITVIGVPLGFIALVLYLIALYLSQIPVALLIGRLILKGYVSNQAIIRTIVALVLGLFLLLLIGFIPFLNVLAGLLTVLFGLGAMAVWLHSLKRPTVVVAPFPPTQT